METFKLTAKLTITTFTSIEAETLEEAIELAKDRHDMMHVSTNNGDSELDVWMIDELDGMPYEIKSDDD